MTASVHRARLALSTMCAGLTLTVFAAVAPYVHRNSSRGLAGHIRAGYPTYSPARVSQAADTYLVYLTILNVLGASCWLVIMWAVVKRKRWTLWAAVAVFATAVAIASFNLLVKDTSGDTGLPATLGWIGLLPCVPGVLALVVLGRRS